MKTMYTGTLKQNAFIFIFCFLSTVTIISINDYLKAKEKARDNYFRTGTQIEVSYVSYLSNGFTLKAN